jgi:hypothetical protein
MCRTEYSAEPREADSFSLVSLVLQKTAERVRVDTRFEGRTEGGVRYITSQ